MENEIEEQNSQVAEEENFEENNETEEEVSLTVEDYRKLEAKNKELFARAKKAEEEAKIAKQTLNKPKEEQPKDVNILEEVDIRLLKRDNFSDEDIENLKIIQAGERAMGREIDLITASKNPMFINNRAIQEAEARKMKAQLPASTGSGTEKETAKSPEEFKKEVKAESDALLKNLLG